MSDYYLQIISTNPEQSILENLAERAVHYLQSIYKQTDTVITYTIFDSIQFIDCGQNFSSVLCPFCGKQITNWWSEEMSRLYSESKFASLYAKVPCCEIIASLSQLHYCWPCGFSSYQITLTNINEPISRDTLNKLEQIMSTSLHLIYQHL